MPERWVLARGRAVAFDRPRLMAIINCTPDSFHAASRAFGVSEVLGLANSAVDEGADMLDLGGESTRPGAQRVGADEQIRRVVPAIEAIRARGGAVGAIPISVDTTSARVAAAALDAGADAINDVSGGSEDPGMLTLAGDRGAGVVLMHRLTTPERDRYSDAYDTPPEYENVVETVVDTLRDASRRAMDAGVDRASIVWDPGLGFGKGVGDTLALLRGTPGLVSHGFCVLSALSRKSFVGRLSLGRDSTPDERLSGTLAMSTLHLSLGARMFRVHDVAAHRGALDAAWAVLGGGAADGR